MAASSPQCSASFSGPSDGRAFELVRADGAVTLSNSKEGVAILGGFNLRPGQRSTGMRGYFGKRSSVFERRHIENTLPRPVRISF